ncbi:MAG TPA: YbaL family putative K(+) efflux transporter [Roseateles sp.]|nr:YbaL family putative K(+) efflux transporter [Roseateles sp.]HWT53835.1 YbaL family putative K(+) efflux transporter [Rhodocyclaceae bacterium]
MPHHTPLIATIVGAIVIAFVFGALAQRMRLPPLIGYLLAGVAVGPFTPGFVADQGLAGELAELGVILLMFGVGLHFSMKDLLAVKNIAIPGALVQIAAATMLGLGLTQLMGWSLGGGLVFGLALSVASTVVLLQALQDRHLLDTREGHIAVGWLIVEDLAMVLTLVLIPALAGMLGGNAGGAEPQGGDLTTALLLTVGKVVAFVGVMLIFGRRFIPWLLGWVAKSGSKELFRLCVLAITLGFAYGSAIVFDVSFALGAFFAGMILSESELSHRAAEETLPLRDAFSVLFFVAAGMLFDPSIVLREPLAVLATVATIILGKSLAAFLIVLAFRHPLKTALTVAASLAQIGEFSFILANVGLQMELLPKVGKDLILAGAIISIIVNPFVFAPIKPLTRWLEHRFPRLAASKTAAAEGSALLTPTTLKDHVVIVGYGRVGSLVAEGLAASAVPYAVIEDDDKVVQSLYEQGIDAYFSDGVSRKALERANVMDAKCLLLTIPNVFESAKMVELAHKMNPQLRIVARAYSDAEAQHLLDVGATHAITGEREIAIGMATWLVDHSHPGAVHPA